MYRIGFFPAHPSQLWMMKALYDQAPSEIKVIWFIREKDISKDLIKNFEIPYKLVSKARKGYLGNFAEFFINIFKFISFTRENNLDIWLSKYGAVNLASWILRKKSISFNDDDADIVPFIALTSYPFANKVLCTKWTRMGIYKKKARKYKSFHELFYLHPKRFSANFEVVKDLLGVSAKDGYVIVRLSSLQAHHDASARGVSDEMLEKLLNRIKRNFRVFITSERPLKSKFEPYRLNIPVDKIHDVLAYSKALVGDSQTMIAEAAVLGVPGLRISTFSKKISYLDELERRGLCRSVTPGNDNEMLTELEKLLETESSTILLRRQKLLNETIDPVPFFWREILS